MSTKQNRLVPTLKVHQWLPGWDRIDFNPNEHRSKPEKHFYLFSLPARELRSLSGIARRVAKGAAPRTADLGIQRQHDPDRSEEISRFVEYGFPWSTLSKTKRAKADFNDLRKPGWLPTAVVLNILTKEDERYGSTVADSDLVSIVNTNGATQLKLPYDTWRPAWSPVQLPPFEIIDGQHRLWAFDGANRLRTFELPVVAFLGLDISWQAYLFWTINIKPKRINPSLAFDLYPLLRSEDWLEREESHIVYRETRAQELTEVLWSFPKSPWYDRINMLGERRIRWVTQSAWIKSLSATFVRSWDRRSKSSGGLFGGRSSEKGEVLGWSRAQQAAFLVFSWDQFQKAISETKLDWAEDLRRSRSKSAAMVRKSKDSDPKDDLAFYGRHSLIATDQGVRGFLHVLNDLCYIRASRLRLNSWRPDDRLGLDLDDAVESSLETLKDHNFTNFITRICQALVSFDWRSSSAPELEEELRRAKLVFRGSGGYKEIRIQLLEHLAEGTGEIGEAAKLLLERS